MPRELKPEDIVKAKTMKMFDYINNNQIDSVHFLYPDFSEEYMILPSDSIYIKNVISDEKNKTLTVNLTNYFSANHIDSDSEKRNIILTYCLNDSNEYIVQKSVGLVDKDNLPLEAEVTGYLKAKVKGSDYELIKDLNILDSIKAEIKNRLFEEAKGQVELELWYRRGSRAKVFYRVLNYSRQTIGTVQFNATYKYETWPSYTFKNAPYAKNISPNSYRDVDFDVSEFYLVRYEKGDIGTNTYVDKYDLISYKLTNITFPLLEVSLSDYTGNEYEEYLKRHSKLEKNQLPQK
jgi:hypothetical protein